jgi:hypothetical protein
LILVNSGPYYDPSRPGDNGIAQTSAGYRRILRTLTGYTFGPYVSPWLNLTWQEIYLQSTTYEDPPVWY